jgi:serine/threonine protein phosphatase PrpC
LSTDHKPNLPKEEERILNSGGRVEPFQERNGEFVGPPRVWLQNEQLPGLAMSRSFGDLVAVHVGVISEPELQTHRLTDDDKFLVIASDGVWEFISSHECVRIVSEFYEKNDIDKGAEELVKEAVFKWQKEDNIVDDITVVLVFFSR